MKFTHRLAAALGALGLALLCLPLQAQAPAAGNPTLLRAINTIRQQGCGQGPARAPALREDPALSRAAMMISGGAKLEDALQAMGYRSLRAAKITVSGITGPAALTPRILAKSCATVMAPYLLEAGFHQRGKQTWVVLDIYSLVIMMLTLCITPQPSTLMFLKHNVS